ncbi:molybdate ABC transporter substrate-binding protein [Paenibacillus sp. TRM 82003]|uniref:molybdate ABC transporter substrate-binding protein n=1 Tax=Kineococcus sp. TRM81007 TaxID=2925831 RepID=UPI001F5675AF|nr:molybdate ABC transporter substrate-binding protein [Kineococcus sp. TRM81007]MCI2240491.1 molybdate ABC transporter substrate-binding protein [Kineococcus sp. TRM81007]MCI3925224.1 molybdate ABC transporter substrate-binding protein [Paenibacillus sp. TRM 82003]
MSAARRRAPVAAALTALLAGLIAGCGAAAAPDGDTLTVFAAASLQEVFTEVAEDFERDHPGVDVALSSAGSADLATQVLEGAPADVFASADEATMARVAGAGLVAGEPEVFATNVLTVATPAGNPAGVTSLADLARPGLAVVVCAPQVPCGAAARRVQEAAGVALTPVSEESSVTDVLGKVTTGQADAGLVYATDVARAGDAVTAVPLPEAAGAVNTCPVAALRDAADPALAAEFVEAVTGEAGRAALAAAGFGVPAA